MLQTTSENRDSIFGSWEDLADGSSGYIDIERAWLRKAQELFTLFCKKQHDYGPVNIGISGMAGVTIRAADKVSRLFELLGIQRAGKSSPTNISIGERQFSTNTKEASNESLRDSFLDLANYGIIAMLVHDGDWESMTPEEAWRLGKLC